MSAERVDRIVRFIEGLRLWQDAWAGEPVQLIPRHRAIVERIYGPDREDGERLVQAASIWWPSGNAKTALAAMLGLAHFMGPEAVPGGEVILAAAKIEQAAIAFRHCSQMIDQDATLRARVDARPSRRELWHPGTRSILRVISSDADSEEGLSASFFLADEVAVWHPAKGRALWNAVDKSMVKRRNPLRVSISTAGEVKGGFGFERWQDAKRRANGELQSPRHVVDILAAEPGDDLTDEALWSRLNPAIAGGFKSLDFMRDTHEEARENPADLIRWYRYHLNLWPDAAWSPWVDMGRYDGAAPQRTNLRGKTCWLGLDLSAKSDMTAAALVFPDHDSDGSRRWDVLLQCWLPEEGIGRKAEIDRADYLRWAEEGWLTLTPGVVIHHQAVHDWIMAQTALYDVREVAVDPALATWMNTQLLGDGVNVVQYSQGELSMAAPVREIYRAIMAGDLRHGGNPILRMCMSNVVTTRTKNENEVFHKGKSTGRIDGAVATANAIGRSIASEAEPVKTFEFSF